MPVLFTDAVAGALLLHVPPVVVFASVMVEPTQTTEGPVMEAADGRGLTVTIRTESAVPQPLVTE